MAEFEEDPHDFDVYARVAPEARTYHHIHFDTAAGIARLTLNRAPANVLSIEMMEEISAALESLEYERAVKLVVFMAQGKYFSVGFEIPDHTGDRAYLMLEGLRRIVENLGKLDKPTLAVVAGPATGAGSVIAAACDMVLAAEKAAKFGHPEIRAGVFNTVAAALLPRLVGRKRAYEMLLGGGLLTAAEAERVGLITRAIPDEKLDSETAAVIQRFQEGSAPVYQYARRAIAGGLDLTLADAVRHAEDVYLNPLLNTEDVEEGLRAVTEKRKPQWKDR
ncbi:MAG TPA: enoyl-CoA hydratase/isomerase family protein [Vicinamibacteria bacterium]|nr:enoyl-CoA hydratase/isomerase family protein [Vicinamibacteria bacterium]